MRRVRSLVLGVALGPVVYLANIYAAAVLNR